MARTDIFMGRREYGVLRLYTVFTALHAIQTRSSDEKAVGLSVRLSVCQTCGLWQNGRKICPDFYTWKII